MNKARPLLAPRTWFHLLILRPLLRLLFGVSVEGRAHLAGLERFILASNHNSHLDVPLLFSVLPVRRLAGVRPVAARDYFQKRPLLFRVVNALFRPVWIDREGPSERAVDSMLAALEAGESLIIFPEGTRGEPGRIGRFRSGVGRLAGQHPDLPVLPVFLHGPERALPKDSAVPLPIWNRVLVGPPQRFAARAEIVTSLEAMIRELSESETAKRHRRIERPRRCLTLAVLGIDGSGKSTLSRRVAEELSGTRRVARVSDSLEFYESGSRTTVRALPSEAVRQALGRYAKTAKSLKHYKIPKLAELLLRDHLLGEVRRWHAPEVVIMDGSPLINMTAWARLYKEELHDPRLAAAALKILTGRDETLDAGAEELLRLPELAAMKRLRLVRLTLPDAVVMLDVNPAVCMERIHGRGEKVQAHETAEKLARLREGYLMVCEVVRKEFGTKVLVLDGGLDPETLTATTLGFVAVGLGETETQDGQRAR
jgi:1-acyl-sn-glycerol-3-phosphate acyltransferase